MAFVRRTTFGLNRYYMLRQTNTKLTELESRQSFIKPVFYCLAKYDYSIEYLEQKQMQV